MIFLIVVLCCLASIIILAMIVARRTFVVVQVLGRSMLPGFRPGDRVLVRRAVAARLRVGAVAVVQVQERAFRRGGPPALATRWVIKRVAAMPGDPVPGSVRAAAGGISIVPDGKLVLLSDNPSGTDSRRWGLVPASDLLGPVVATLPAVTRRGQAAARGATGGACGAWPGSGPQRAG